MQPLQLLQALQRGDVVDKLISRPQTFLSTHAARASCQPKQQAGAHQVYPPRSGTRA